MAMFHIWIEVLALWVYLSTVINLDLNMCAFGCM